MCSGTLWFIKANSFEEKKTSVFLMGPWSAVSLVEIMSFVALHNLKEYRQMRSIVERIPIYCVFGDTVMRSISQTMPESLEALSKIRGLTKDKCDMYGEDILRLIRTSHVIHRPTGAGGDRRGGGPQVPAVVLRHKLPAFKKKSPDQHTIWGGTKPVKDLGQSINTSSYRLHGISTGKEGIYVLELAQGRVYVGHSNDVRRRIQQHMSGQGSAFTKCFPPTGIMLPRLGCVTGSAEAAERDETLRYMFLRGIDFVRGWRYVRVSMPEEEHQDAEENIRELFDLCRRCGHPGHFITHCKANFDRLGRPCQKP
jgi:predicted GIY-YIG superfamily endonuclease